MDIDYLVHLAGFENRHILDKEKEIDKLRIQFISDYTKDAIREMKIDEYITGKGDSSTFCNRIETELLAWGNIKGGYATKFGIYYGTSGYDLQEKYRIAKKWGGTIDKAFNKIKKEIINLIEAGGINDIVEIKNNLISPMLKGKILSLYYPNYYLNIYSSSHLDFFINQLNIGLAKGLSEIDKQNMIMEYKNSDDLMKTWSVYKFTRFLYYIFGSPTNERIKGVIDIEDGKPKMELFSKEVNYEIIELKIKSLPNNYIYRKSANIKKYNYEGKSIFNKRIGDRGELIVYQSEIDKLHSFGMIILAKKIKHIAKEDDNAGYDILSYDQNGDEIYIEVKSTRAKQGDATFYLTANELERANGDMRYWIYVVFETNTSKPKIWRIKNPFKCKKDEIRLEPVSYKVRIGVE